MMEKNKNAVPKKIHYCWFGNKEKDNSVKKMIETWKKHCKEYEIIEWNESNFDVNMCQYVKEAYMEKKYAFVSDYVRVKVLYEQGGIYMDTDVELLCNLDNFLNEDLVMSFQDEKYLNTGLIIAQKENKILKEILRKYNDRSFIIGDGKKDLTSNPVIFTETLKKYGMKVENIIQRTREFLILPNEYFCPLNYQTRKINRTYNTIAIHWFSGTWLSNYKKIKLSILRYIKRIIGKKFFEKVKNILKR